MAGIRPLTRTVAYSAAKAEVANLTQWLAVHMAQTYSPCIRMNAIAPGFLSTAQNHYLLFDAETGALTPRGQSIFDHTPMGRFGEPADLVSAVLCGVGRSVLRGRRGDRY
jgi:NAD(P)-dependent dehydrogenase (short-subunit alcohol dehydrogenase family)